MRRMALLLLVVLLAGAGTPPPSGRIAGRVTVTAAGEAQKDASGVVVYVTGFREPPPRAPAPEMMQRGRRFDPPLLAITAGQEVSFPNADPFFHNVFSLSPGQKFDLGQYRRGESKQRLFKELGPVEVYCNIHPEMAATIVVVPNRAHAAVAADGTFTIANVQAGTWTVFAYTRLAVQPAKTEVTVTAGGEATVSLELTRGPQPGHKNKYGETYKDPEKYR
jgi:plastocyanin